MKGKLLIVAGLIVVLGLPFLLRKEDPMPLFAEDTVVVIAPHTESIRQEFARGFSDWYERETGRTVYVDYRVIGGTSEITQFLNSEYLNAFRNYWTEELGNTWSREVQEAFSGHRIEIDATPGDDSVKEAARRAFLTSGVSAGIDVFFGGGSYDFSVQARRGNLVPGGLLEKHPDWFMEAAPAGEIPPAIPRIFSGETYYDESGRWYGAVLSSYGIIYNRNALKSLGIENEPRQWADLADPRYFGQLGVSDPTKSGSITQAFEMIIQQQMQRRLETLQAEFPDKSGELLEKRAVSEGWLRAMRIIQRISANARYFTDTSQKPNIDVAMGDCAAGMSIGFYGRFQQENILARSGDARFGFHTPKGGSTISADPVGLLRGAPNEDVARKFLEYVLSVEGQKLWNFEVGSPGGPETFPLRRSPIRPELYREKYNQYRSDKDYVPYIEAKDFTYHREWTGHLFSEIRSIIRTCFIDVRKELVQAWRAIIEARKRGDMEAADAAEEVFSDLERISYGEATTTVDAGLDAPQIEEVRMSRELSEYFRDKYNRVKRIAEGR